MKYLLMAVFATCVLSCQLLPENANKTKSSTASDTLYGFSNFDGKNHFVKVAWQTGKSTILSTIDTATTVTGTAVIDPDRGAYCFVSGNSLVVISVLNGSRVKSFELTYPNTGGLVYNSNSGKLNGISTIDHQFHFVEIDIDNQTMNVIQTLTPLHEYLINSSAIDNTDSRYYVLGFDTLRAIDTGTGAVTNTYVLPGSVGNNIGGLRTIAGGKLFGMSYSTSGGGNFFSFDPSTKVTSVLGSFKGGSTGDPGIDITGGNYFYLNNDSNGDTVLNCIDVGTGSVVASKTLSYNSYELMPLTTVGSPAD